MILLDYYEFVDCYFLQLDDEPDALDHDEQDQLRLFYTMYESLSDESDGFENALDLLCTTDDTYIACTGDSDRCERRDEIKNDVLSHLTDGLERCGHNRSNVLQGANSINETLSQCYGIIDEVGDGVDPDEIDIESMIDEIRSPVDELASVLSPSSWFTEWEKDKYAIGPFVKCLRQLRARQERDFAAMKERVEQETANVKEDFEQTLAERH